MLAELTVHMKTAAGMFPAGKFQAIEIWGFSLSEIIAAVCDKALELGRNLRPEIEQAAKTAIDALVEFDLPFVPSGIEGKIDDATRDLGYAAVVAVLDAILGK